MIYKNIFKNPILAIGILLMTIFILNANRKGLFGKREKLIPTSCKAVRVKLDRRIPDNWKSACKGNNLSVNVNYQLPKELAEKQLTFEEFKRLVYREIANVLIHIARNSPSDNLERTDVVSVKFKYLSSIDVNAITFGDKLAKLNNMKEQNLIATHIQATVKVQEVKFDIPQTSKDGVK